MAECFPPPLQCVIICAGKPVYQQVVSHVYLTEWPLGVSCSGRLDVRSAQWSQWVDLLSCSEEIWEKSAFLWKKRFIFFCINNLNKLLARCGCGLRGVLQWKTLCPFHTTVMMGSCVQFQFGKINTGKKKNVNLFFSVLSHHGKILSHNTRTHNHCIFLKGVKKNPAVSMFGAVNSHPLLWLSLFQDVSWLLRCKSPSSGVHKVSNSLNCKQSCAVLSHFCLFFSPLLLSSAE